MAGNNLNQIVLDAFLRTHGSGASQGDAQSVVQGFVPGSGDILASALSDASRQIDDLRSANQSLADVVRNNTQAVTQNSAAQTGKSAASTAGSIASTIFGSGLGLVPLVSAVARLLGGGNTAPVATSMAYAPPSPLRLDLGDTAQSTSGILSFAPISYGQNGLPRPAQENAPTQNLTAGPQISIQVNAIDSRSFMDHSYEIAQAVREAMLNSHAVNDVVTDL